MGAVGAGGASATYAAGHGEREGGGEGGGGGREGRREGRREEKGAEERGREDEKEHGREVGVVDRRRKVESAVPGLQRLTLVCTVERACPSGWGWG